VKTLVAGIGNIFFGDDGFGVEVAHRLLSVDLPDGVRVVDYGIRGVHLAYDMLDGFDVVVLVDTIARGDEPGTVSLLDVTASGGDVLALPRPLDPHGMAPDAVLELVRSLGGEPAQVYVVGCEPVDCEERMGLSPVVAAAVENGVRVVLDLVDERRTVPPAPIAPVPTTPAPTTVIMKLVARHASKGQLSS